VFNGKHSYFGKLLTQRLTKIINLPVFKNSGNAISMATKNIGYGAVCNTNRSTSRCSSMSASKFRPSPRFGQNGSQRHRQPPAQYDGGPDSNAKFAYIDNRIFLATDPFALDMACHNIIVAKRKAMGVPVNENPRSRSISATPTAGWGVVAPEKTVFIRA
jgi:hypothetical protein